jgi:hypothetical protein
MWGCLRVRLKYGWASHFFFSNKRALNAWTRNHWTQPERRLCATVYFPRCESNVPGRRHLVTSINGDSNRTFAFNSIQAWFQTFRSGALLYSNCFAGCLFIHFGVSVSRQHGLKPLCRLPIDLFSFVHRVIKIISWDSCVSPQHGGGGHVGASITSDHYWILEQARNTLKAGGTRWNDRIAVWMWLRVTDIVPHVDFHRLSCDASMTDHSPAKQLFYS